MSAPLGRTAAATGIASVAPLLWGTTYITTSELLPAGHPVVSAHLRALPAGIVLVALSRSLPPRAIWTRLLALSALNIGGFFVLLFYAAYALPGGTAATLSSMSPVFALLLGTVWLGQRPRPAQLGAAATCVAGVALVVGGAPGLDPAGALAALGAGLCTAAGVVLTRRWRLPLTTTALTGWQLLLGGLLVAPLIALTGEGMPWLDGPALLGYAYLGLVGTGVAYLAWMHGIKELPVGAVSALACLSPVTAAALDWLVLDRPLAPWQCAGAALVLGGVLACQLAAQPAAAGRRRARRTAPIPMPVPVPVTAPITS